MKWFRHYTNSSQDEFMLELEEEFGLNGYAWWWKMLEAIAAKMSHHEGSTVCSLTSSWTNWQSILRGKRKKLKRFFDHCENKNEIKQEENGNILKITCPKLLQIMDEYHRKSGQKSEKVRSQSIEVEGREQKEEKEKTHECVLGTEFLDSKDQTIQENFEEDWVRYKNPKGNKEWALKNYSKSVGLDKSKRRKLLETMDKVHRSEPDIEFLPHASTFFKEWQDMDFDEAQIGEGGDETIMRENFEEDWEIYPRKNGEKERAFHGYFKTVGTNPLKRQKILRKIQEQNKKHPDGKFLFGGEKFFKDWQELDFKADGKVDNKLKGLVL